MSIIDEIIQDRDAGKLSLEDGVALFQDDDLFPSTTSEQLRDFAVSELIDIELAKRRINYDEENAIENARQRETLGNIVPIKTLDRMIEGPSSLGITRLAGDLLSGRKLQAGYEDSVLAKDFKGKILGIDGRPAPDSEIRVFNKLNISTDPESGDELFTLEKVGVPTEYMSPREIQRQYDIYLSNTTNPNQRNRLHFNSSNVAEYYGQQGLKLAGYSAPSNKQRSEFQRLPGNEGKPFSTLNTDRIIENTPQSSIPEGILAGDYRYVTPTGKVRVGDYQTGDTTGDIRLNVIKAANLMRGDSFKLEKNLRGEMNKNRTYDIDKAIAGLISKDVLPGYTQGTPQGRYGMRPGKILSNAPTAGKVNTYSQFRYDDLLFGLSTRENRLSEEGMIPQNLVLVDNNKVREIVGRKIIDNSINNSGPVLEINRDPRKSTEKIDAMIPVSALLSGTQSGKPLLNEELMSQLRRPYRFR